MKLSHITAISKNGVIGINNNLPWQIPEELQLFKKLTMGKTVIIGRKTFESLPTTLKGRNVIVLTKQSVSDKNVSTAHSLHDALKIAQNDDEVLIAGGLEVYTQTFPLISTLYLSMINEEFDGNVYFPVFDQNQFTTTLIQKYSTNPSFSFYKMERNFFPINHTIDSYLSETEIFNFSNELVQQLVKTLKNDTKTEKEYIYECFTYVRNQIHHSADHLSKAVTAAASEVLEFGEGICYAKSHLLCALLRADNIPCGLSYQLLRLVESDIDSPLIVHGIIAYYHSEKNSWILLDPRGNKHNYNEKIDTEANYFEFDVNINLNEKTIPYIFSDPDSNVLNALQCHTNAISLMENLPNTLGDI
jgi:dihydrofolate reductase